MTKNPRSGWAWRAVITAVAALTFAVNAPANADPTSTATGGTDDQASNSQASDTQQVDDTQADTTSDDAQADDSDGTGGEAGTQPVDDVEAQPAVVTGTDSTAGITSTTVEAVTDAAPSASALPDVTVVADIVNDSAGNFQLVGVTWDDLSGSDYGMHVRTQASGEWSEWYDVTPDSDGLILKSTEPIYVTDSTAVEIQVTGTSDTQVSGLSAVLIDSPTKPTDPVDAAPRAAVTSGDTQNKVFATGSSVAQPSMITRDQWSAMPQDDCEGNSDTIRGIAVHHTDGSNDYAAGDSASIVRGIQYYHEVTNGWCDIGYNFLVDKYGQIFEGRGGGLNYPVHGAHATTWNWETAGISMMMNSNTYNPSDAAMSSLEKVIAWKVANNYLDPKGRVTLGGKNLNVIFRHGDVMGTECPGTNITSRMDEIRNAVASLVSGKTYSSIYDTWQANGGESGSYGVVYEMEHPVSGGRMTTFANGSIYASSGGNIITVHGAIGNRYVGLGAEHSFLGVPTGPETCGLKDGGCYQWFQGGTIMWSPNSGANPINGAILGLWQSTGNENGFLGYPTSGENCGIKDGGCYQYFQGAIVHWSPNTGAQATRGAIRNLWGSMNWENGKLGYPTMNESCTIKDGGCYQWFQGGLIYWSPATDAHAVLGAIENAYSAQGYENGKLGYPTMNESCTIKDSGCYQHFQDGSIYWSPATGAHTVGGAIRNLWSSTGWENGYLGYPTTDERCTIRDNGCYQVFQYGTIHWTPNTGAHATHGAIRDLWQANGLQDGSLGYPTSEEIPDGNGVYQLFEHGRITWNPSEGARISS